MRNETCIRFTYILSSIFLLTNCSGGGKATTSNTFVSNESISVTADLDQAQRNIATRICYAYQSKSNNFHSSDYLKSNYNFTNINNACEAFSQYNVVAKLNDNSDDGFYFSTTSSKQFNTVIQTDTSGYLSKLCAKIYKGNQSISNTVTNAGQMTQIYFYTESGVDSYILKYFVQSGTTYVATQSETFKVTTSLNYQSGKILGMDEEYIQQGTCSSNSSKVYSFDQKFISYYK